MLGRAEARQRKRFLAAFIDRIVVRGSEAALEYTFPVSALENAEAGRVANCVMYAPPG